LNEDIVVINPLNNANTSTPPNKIVISLVNIERETGGGINFKSNAVSDRLYNRTLPGWQLNLYVLFAAVFTEKQYEESLQILSSTLHFLQKNKNWIIPGTTFEFSIEPVNLSFSELSNLWSICGSTYYPSILCKIRTIDIDNNEISKLPRAIMNKETTQEQKDNA